jgi:hypothetical protein
MKHDAVAAEINILLTNVLLLCFTAQININQIKSNIYLPNLLTMGIINKLKSTMAGYQKSISSTKLVACYNDPYKNFDGLNTQQKNMST